jgi:hypothetical protein
VVPGEPLSSVLLMNPLVEDASVLLVNPLAEEAGGSHWHAGGGSHWHAGGKHWTTQDAGEWQTLAAWVQGRMSR